MPIVIQPETYSGDIEFQEGIGFYLIANPISRTAYAGTIQFTLQLLPGESLKVVAAANFTGQINKFFYQAFIRVYAGGQLVYEEEPIINRLTSYAYGFFLGQPIPSYTGGEIQLYVGLSFLDGTEGDVQVLQLGITTTVVEPPPGEQLCDCCCCQEG